MKRLKLIIFLIAFKSSLAQKFHNDFALNYKTFSYDVDKRMNSINKAFGTNFAKSNLEFIGLSITHGGYWNNGKRTLPMSFITSYFCYGLNRSQKINDTLCFSTGGWNIGMELLGRPVIRTKKDVFFISLYGGGFIGQDKSRFSKEKLPWWSLDHDLYIRKALLTLSGGIEVRLHLFQRISIYYKPMYYFEPFKFKTRTKGDMPLPIDNQRYIGLSHTFGLGYILGYR